MVDGIIGEVLAKNAVQERFARGFTAADLGIKDVEWDTLPPGHQSAFIEDLAIGVEIESDFEHNPVYREVAKLNKELGWPSASQRFVDAPGVERDSDGRRHEDPPVFGAQCVVRTEDVGTVTRTVWLPNFQAPGFIGLGLAEEMAHLIALDEVRRRRRRL